MQGSSYVVPDTVVVAGLDPEDVIAGGDIGVVHAPFVTDVGPVLVEALQNIGKRVTFGVDIVEGGITDGERSLVVFQFYSVVLRFYPGAGCFSPKLSAQISTFEMMTRGIRVFTLSCVGSKERNKLFPPT